MANENLTEIICIVDRSGSMASSINGTIEGFNEFLTEQQGVDGDVDFTYVQFDTEIETVHDGVDIMKVSPLNRETFVPRGMTALYDAIGFTLSKAANSIDNTVEADRPSKTVVVIVTDGAENSSQEFNQSQANDLISELTREYDWQFVYLGANQDSFGVGANLGIAMAGTANYVATDIGTQNAYANISHSITNYRNGTTNSVNIDKDDDGTVKDSSTNE